MKIKNLFLCFLSAIVLSLPYGRFNLGIFAWVGFLPLFFAIDSVLRRQGFWLAYFCGFLFFLFTIFWLRHVTFFGLLILCLYLALYFAFFGFFFDGLRRRIGRRRILVIFLIACLWIILEYIRGYLFTGFPWALLGYSQYLNTSIIQIADIVGCYGVSFIVFLVNLLLYEIIKALLNRDYFLCMKFLSIIILVFLVVISYGRGAIGIRNKIEKQSLESSLVVDLVQGNIPQEEKWQLYFRDRITDKYFLLTQQFSDVVSDLVIWPETAIVSFITNRESLQPFINFTRNINKSLLFGAVYQQDSKFYNSAFLILRDSQDILRYDKIHLVPFGEYTPFSKYFPFLAEIIGIGDFTSGEHFTVFSMRNSTGQNFNFGVLICFEDIFPDLSRQFRLKGADFLVNITNDAWFKNSRSPYQHLQASVFRAVENRVFVVRAANTGVTCEIDNFGRIRNRVQKDNRDIFVEGSIRSSILKNNKISFYTRHGDIFVLFCCLYVVIVSILLIVLNKPMAYHRFI